MLVNLLLPISLVSSLYQEEVSTVRYHEHEGNYVKPGEIYYPTGVSLHTTTSALQNVTAVKTTTEPLMECVFCLHSRKKKDVADDVNQDPDCMNRPKILSRPDLRRKCTDREIYCTSTVTNLNGLFVMVERDCAQECNPGCEEHGYGLFYSECTRCCTTPMCNGYDGASYYAPLSASSNTVIFIVLIVFFIFIR